MLILGLLGMYFDAVVVFVNSQTLLLKLAVTILCLSIINFSQFGKNLVQWNLDLRKPDLRKNLDLRKIVGTTDFLVHKLFDLRKIF